MKIALFGKQLNEKFVERFQFILSFFEKKGIEVAVYRSLAEDIAEKHSLKVVENCSLFTELEADVTMVLSIGGDGTFLNAATLVRDKGIPILGINSGRLGFLAAVAPDEVENALECLVDGAYKIEDRSLIELVSPKGIFGEHPYALNELGIFKNNTTSMVTVKAYVDDELLTNYWSDGLLLATPTGSTAYSLSAGGPIISPECSNLVIAPVSPHNLTMRPIVIEDKKTLRFRVECRSSHYLISLDSRFGSVSSGTEIIAKKADFTIKVVKFATTSFYKTLRNKLMWGMDRRN